MTELVHGTSTRLRPAESAILSRSLALLLVPVAALGLVHAFMAGVARAVPWDPSNPQKWVFADAVHYLSIAREGYWLAKPDMGNTAWFPGYSVAIRLLSPGADWDAFIGLTISNACCLACMYIVWATLHPIGLRKAIPTIIAFAFAPGFLFLHAISPTAMALLIAMLFQIALLKRRWAWAVVMAAAGSFVYSTGFVLAAVAGLWLLLERDVNWRTKFAVGGAIGLVSCLVVLTVFQMQDAQSGTARAFFVRQSEFGNHGMSNPLVTVWRYAIYCVSHPGLIAQVPILTVALLGTIAVAALHRWRGADRLLVLYAAIMWFFPLSVGTSPTPWRSGVTPWRPMALCSPLITLAAKLPTWTIYLIILIELAFAALSVIRFGQERLV